MGLYDATIFRYHDYDSISVDHYLLPISITFFHPGWFCNYNTLQYGDTLPDYAKTYIRQAFHDSTMLLPYCTDFSPQQPFGFGQPYALDGTTGGITFTAPDSGLYHICYRTTEYRDGLPLGQVTAGRLVYVQDSNAIIPTATWPQGLNIIPAPGAATGGYYDAANDKLWLHAGATASFDVKVTSPLNDAQVIAKTDLGTLFPGSPSFSTGGSSSDSLWMHWSWTAPESAVGRLYYPYIDWADTACNPGHMPIHQSSGMTVSVLAALPTGVGEAATPSAQWMVVYPNPGGEAGGHVRLHRDAGACRVRVVDGMGRQMGAWMGQPGVEYSFGQGWPAGVYTVEAVGERGGARMIKRWVKQ